MKKSLLLIALTFLLAACSSSQTVDISHLPEGDSTRGEALYQETINGAPACSTCHSLTGERIVGPSLQGFGLVAATRIEALNAEEYSYQSIVRPASHLVDGYSNLMYTQYQSKLSAQEIADLMAYILSQ